MKKNLFTIILLLFCLLMSHPAEARLTLGVITGTGQASGEILPERVQSLASLLAEKLQEDVVVKEFADPATLVNWLDRFAAIDLALLTTKDVRANRGRFILVGPLDGNGILNLVARQGIAGDLPRRAGEVIREFGGPLPEITAEPDRPKSPDSLQFSPEEPSVETIEEIIALSAKVPSFISQDKNQALVPQEDRTILQPLPVGEAAVKKLLLAVVPEHNGLVTTSAQAVQLAAYLEKNLPVKLMVKEFSDPDVFAKWFMRHRMVDLAILPPALAEAVLGRDYLPLVRLIPVDAQGPDSFELVVGRRGRDTVIQMQLQAALLDMTQANEGRQLLAELRVDKVLAPVVLTPEEITTEKALEGVAKDWAPLETVKESAGEIMVEVELPILSTSDQPVPIQPFLPPEPVTAKLPGLPAVVEATVVLPEPAMPGIIPATPVPVEQAQVPLLPAVPETMPFPDSVMVQSEPPRLDVPLAPAPDDVWMPAIPAVKAPGAEPLLPRKPGAEPAPHISPAKSKVALPELPQPPAIMTAPPFYSDALPPPLVGIREAPVAPLPPAEPKAIVQQEPPPSAPEEPFVVSAPKLFAAPEREVGAVAVAEPLPPALVEIHEALVPPVVKDSPKAMSPLPEKVEPTEIASAQIPENPVAAMVPAPPPVDDVAGFEPESLTTLSGSPAENDRKILEELMQFAEPVALHELSGVRPVVKTADDDLSDDEIKELLGENPVVSLVSQPDIPQQLRPPGIPVIRPGRLAQHAADKEETELLASPLPEPITHKGTVLPKNLLPEPDPEPGIVYVLPFVAIMVPDEVNELIFDQLVDTLNGEGAAIGLQFVILKEGLQRVDQSWLDVRKYVTGEIYGYVEDSGCCSTDLRTRARLSYYGSNQQSPAFDFEYPVKSFFDHDRSSIEVERARLAEDIATTLAGELIKALRN